MWRFMFYGGAVLGVLMLFRNSGLFAMPGSYTLSADGLAALKAEEGFRDRVYQDSAGHATIGFGHLVKTGESFPGAITLAQGEELLKKDVAIAEAAVKKMVLVPITQGMFDALVSFVFNVGADDDADATAEGLGDSTLLKKLNAGDYTGAANEFLRWIFAGGKPVLAARREREKELFLAGLS